MSDTIDFIVPTIPKPQPRQRHRVITSGGRAFAHNYTPTKDPVNAFKATVQMAAAQAYEGAPLAGPLEVDMQFVMPRPKSLVWKKRPMPRQWDARKPDRDNLMKSVQDALNGLLWADDSQIVAGNVEKFIAAGDEQPHVRIVVKVL
jgi:Holliday junction resolvase RusA-like endonuclease